MKFLKGLLASTLTVGVLSVAVWLTLFNGARELQDWWWLRSYTPTTQIQSLVQAGGYTDEATDIFYVSDPQLISDADNFSSVCNSNEEFSIVLGCYTGGRKVYVFNVNDDRIPDVEEVTAAHEMLHVAFDRLSLREKEELGVLLEAELADLQDTRIVDLTELYRESIFCDASQDVEPLDVSEQGLSSTTLIDPGIVGDKCEETDLASQRITFNSELHSIFGTELSDISPDLEEHYSRFFNDRQSVVRMANNYAQIFTNIENSIAQFDAQLIQLAQDIVTAEADLESLSSRINTEEALLISLRQADNITQYNIEVPVFNQLVQNYNTQLETYRQNILDYNAVVEERNDQAYIQRDLIKSINSNFETKDAQ